MDDNERLLKIIRENPEMSARDLKRKKNAFRNIPTDFIKTLIASVGGTNNPPTKHRHRQNTDKRPPTPPTPTKSVGGTDKTPTPTPTPTPTKSSDPIADMAKLHPFLHPLSDPVPDPIFDEPIVDEVHETFDDIQPPLTEEEILGEFCYARNKEKMYFHDGEFISQTVIDMSFSVWPDDNSKRGGLYRRMRAIIHERKKRNI